MANKYSELSDFEVNKLIADSLGYEYEIGFYYPDPAPVNPIDYNYIKKKVTNNKNFWMHIDYCNHCKDAMGLMFECKITLQPVISSNKWTAIGAFIFNKDGSGACASAVNENPCRAIAECYLLMKAAENNNDK